MLRTTACIIHLKKNFILGFVINSWRKTLWCKLHILFITANLVPLSTLKPDVPYYLHKGAYAHKVQNNAPDLESSLAPPRSVGGKGNCDYALRVTRLRYETNSFFFYLFSIIILIILFFNFFSSSSICRRLHSNFEIWANTIGYTSMLRAHALL